jgi:transposase
MKARTALVNEIRGLFHEYGIILPKGVSKFRKSMINQLEAEQAKLTPLSQELFNKLFGEFVTCVTFEKQLSYDEEKLEAIAHQHPESQRLLTIPGIGVLTATALIAAVSDTNMFKNGRQFAACLGLVPRQHTTGGKDRLLGSANGVMAISANCSSLGPVRPYVGWVIKRIAAVSGYASW